MSETQWSKADRAAAALQTHTDQVAGQPGTSYGDEGSMQFEGAVLLLLLDLKHLLWRADPAMLLTDIVERAVDLWGEEVDHLEAGDPEG